MLVRIAKFAATIVIAGLVFGSGAMASPSLTGSLTATYLFPDTSTVVATTTLPIGSTITCTGGGGGADPICLSLAQPATLTASGLSITLSEAAGGSFLSGSFNGLDFSGLVFNDASTLVGFSLDTDLAGLTASNVSFTSNSIEFNAAGLSFVDLPYHVTLNLVTSSSASSVPEPLTLSIVGAGLAGAVALRRRKKKAV